MIITFTRHDRPDLYDIYYNELRFHNAIGKNKTENYSLQNMKLDSQLAFSIAYRKVIDEPFGLSSVYRNDSWPTGVYRILNRTWKPMGEYHDYVTMKLDLMWTDMMKDQIEWLKSNRSDYRAAVITREHNSRNSLKNLIKQIDRSGIGYSFKLVDDRIWVCNNRSNESCYQDVIYTGDSEVISSWIE